MRKITFLEFIGKDKKSGLLKALKDQAIAEHKNIHKGLGGGLELVISRIGTATFYHRGKRLGGVSNLTLAEAFKKVEEIKAERKKQLEDDKHKDQTPLFKDFFEDWLHEKVAHLKPGSTRVANLRSLFRHTLYPLHNFKLSEITPYLVYSEISKIEQTPGNKHNAVQILSQCLTNASLKGIIPINPLLGMLRGSESPFKAPKKIGRKWVEAAELNEKFFMPLKTTALLNRFFYLLLALSGLRFNECRLLRWEWIDFNKELIQIPTDAVGANKTQKPLVKPLTCQMKKLLLNLQSKLGNTKFVFESFGTEHALAESAFREPWKALTKRECDFHGLRKSLKTWLIAEGDQTEFISELALIHDVRSSLQKTYDKNNYLKEVKAALQLWNDYLEKDLPMEFKKLLR